MSKTAKQKVTNSTTFSLKRDAMEFVVNCVEIICISVMLCLLCVEIGRQTHGRKNRKKSDVKSKDVVSELGGTLKEHLQGFETLLKEWLPPNIDDDITAKLELFWRLDEGCFNDIRDNLVNSHESAVRELQGVLRNKSKLLSGLLVQ